MKASIKSKVLRSLVVGILSLSMCLSLGGNNVAKAYNSTNTESAYSYYYGRSMADLEARIWISTGDADMGVISAKNHFDATSSSWVFNLMSGVYITNHVNSMKLNKTMYGVNLSVNGSGVSGSITQNDGNIFAVSTPSANSYYRGLNVYNACLEFNIVSMMLAAVTATSSQQVYIDGQQFNNSADTTGYYAGPKWL